MWRGATRPPQFQPKRGTMSKAAKVKAPAMREDVAGLKMSRDGDDLVVRFVGVYGTVGIPTATGKDTRKLAASPGMFYWVKDGDKLAHPNPENRRLGLKVTAILGAPRDEAGESKGKARTDGKVMSQIL